MNMIPTTFYPHLAGLLGAIFISSCSSVPINSVEQKEKVEETPIMCEYAAPPQGCRWTGGDAKTGCGAKLVCDSPTPPITPAPKTE